VIRRSSPPWYLSMNPPPHPQARVLGADLIEREAELAVRGHSGDPKLARQLMEDRVGLQHVLVRVPLTMLDFQYDPTGRYLPHPDYRWAGQDRVARTAAYAQLTTPFPPIMVQFGERSANRALAGKQHAKLWVRGGNHRAAAAALRGDASIDAYVPVADWERFVSVAEQLALPWTNPPDTWDTESDDERHERLEAQRRFNRSRAAELSGYVGQRGALFRSVEDQRRSFALTRRIASDTGSDKPWRVSRFDQIGPAGHTYHDTPEAAILFTLSWEGDIQPEQSANPPPWALSLEPTVGPMLIAERNPAAKEWKKPPVCKPNGKVKAKPGDRVRVHRNLHNGCWVVSKGGKVQGYATSLTLKDVRPRVGAAGYGRCMSEQRRNVHAYLDGTLVSLRASSPQGWKRITYNCRDGPAGFYFVGSKSRLFEGAAEARLVQSKAGRSSVYVRGKLSRENPPACGCTAPGGMCSCGSVDSQAVREDGPSCNDPGGAAGVVAVQAGPACVLLDLAALARIKPERWWQDSCPTVLAYRGPGGQAARSGWEDRLDGMSPDPEGHETLGWIAQRMGCAPSQAAEHLVRNGEGWVAHVNGGR